MKVSDGRRSIPSPGSERDFLAFGSSQTLLGVGRARPEICGRKTTPPPRSPSPPCVGDSRAAPYFFRHPVLNLSLTVFRGALASVDNGGFPSVPPPRGHCLGSAGFNGSGSDAGVE